MSSEFLRSLNARKRMGQRGLLGSTARYLGPFDPVCLQTLPHLDILDEIHLEDM